MLTRRERLIRTLRGEAVDRPPVCFYEITGFDEHPDDPDPYNIYSHPSWLPLIELAREHTERTPRRMLSLRGWSVSPIDTLAPLVTVEQGSSRFSRREIKAGQRTLTERIRRDRDIYTDWTEEHLLKDLDDLKAFLALPLPIPQGEADVDDFLKAEAELGDTGLMMIDAPDPLCWAAGLFDMGTYTVIALTEPELFTRLLQKFADFVLPITEKVSEALPGRLWRIVGPEYASVPYLPPRLFPAYVTHFDRQMVEAIHRHGGYARIHSHGRLKRILDGIAATGCDALDPVEPPNQGDVTLAYVREHYGRQMVLFGNLESTDLENLPTPAFEGKILTALREGTAGEGRGFVLMPSACPYGRELPDLALQNYRAMVALTHSGAWRG